MLGLLVGYAVLRCHFRWVAAVLRQLTFLPYLVPGIAFAAAFYRCLPWPAAGSGAVWHPVDPDPRADCRKMPYASRPASRDDPAWERGRGSGADCRCRLVRPPAPYRHPDSGRAAGDRDPAAVYLRDKGVSLFVILLATPATDVLTTWSLRLIDYNYQQAANAVVLMIALISWAGTVMIQKITGTGLAGGWSGEIRCSLST